MVRRDWYDKLTLIISFITVIVLIAGLFVVNQFNVNLKDLKANSLITENLTVQTIRFVVGNSTWCISANETYMWSGSCP
jgi:hypothetical protein